MSKAATNASSSSADDGNYSCNPQAAFKEGKPSEGELDELGGKVAAKWQKLGRHLGIRQAVLDEIEANETEKPYRMLLHWRDTTTSNVLYEDLYHALCHHRVGLNNLAKEFCLVSAKGPSPAKRSRHEVVSAKGPSPAKRSRHEAVDLRIDVKSAEQPENEASQPSVESILCLIADKYLKAAPLRSMDDLNSFLAYMEKMRLIITGYRLGCLLITVKCDSLQILERLWEDYSSGHLGEVVQRCFVTEEILTELSLADLKLETTISEEEYKACKMFVGKDSPKEADETDDSSDSTSDDEDQDGNVAVRVEEPIHVYFTDEESVTRWLEEDDLLTETVKENLKIETDEGCSVADDEDQFGAEAVPLFVEGATHFTEKRDDISFDPGISSYPSSSLSVGSSLSTRTMSSSESSSCAGIGSSQEALPYRIRSYWWLALIVPEGLEKFDVSSAKGLQDYMTYLTHEMCSAVRATPSLKQFTEAMDDKTFRECVTIHVKQGAWQVVMLFQDELIRRDSRKNDEDTVSGDLKSRKLTWWPTKEDQDLQVLCKVLTEEDSKLDSLHLSECELTDEGLEHIAEALSNSHCRLNSLGLIGCELTDEGVKHVAEALSYNHFHLNSLTLRRSYRITDKGVKHIAEALSNSRRHLNSLDLSGCMVTDEGVKHIAEALSNSHCRLNSLDLSHNGVRDKGAKHIAEALCNGHCHLNSLDLSHNGVTDEGAKHIAKALCNSHCPLNSLQLKWCKVSIEGATHLAEVLKDSKYKLKWFSNLLIEVTAEA